MVKESGYGSSFQELILIELTKNKDCEVYLQTFDDLCLPFFFCFRFPLSFSLSLSQLLKIIKK